MPQPVKDLVGKAKRLGVQSLKIDQVRAVVATIRYLWFVRVARRLSTLSEADVGVSERTISHNLTGLPDLAVVRSSTLVRPLSVIESLGPDSRILSIGPRTEGELLNLVGHGFKRANVRGVDLISYSPWVDLGNMHELPYEDDSFDASLMSFVLSYSTERERAASEMVRVTKPGGVIGVAVEWNPLSDEELQMRYGYTVGGERRIESFEEMLAYFGDHVGHLYFHHPAHPGRLERVNSMCAVFAVRKVT